VMLGAALQVIGVPVFGALSDRLGRRPVYMLGAGLSVLTAFPFFWLIDSGRPELLIAALVLGTVGPAAMYGPQSSFFAELFGTRGRSCGVSPGYQLATVFAGGLSPVIATALLAASGGSPAPVALYMLALGALSFASVAAAAETWKVGRYAMASAASQ